MGGNANTLARASANQDVLKTLNWIKGRLESGSSEATIVDTYRSGSSWYRVWSDGFIEQGGWQDYEDNGSKTSFSFLKPFSSLPCVCLGISTNRVDTNAQYRYSHATNVTTSGFEHYYYYDQGGIFGWYACGY